MNKLNEAEAVNINGSLPEDNFPTSPNDLEWNELFKKYVDYKQEDYFVLKVKNLKSVGNTGYLIYAGGATGTKTEKKLFRKVDIPTIDSSKISVTTNKDEASLFTNEDANTFIQAIKKDSSVDTSYTLFEKEPISLSQRRNLMYSVLVLREYFKTLCGGSNDAIKFIESGQYLMNEAFKRLPEPLVGNPFFLVYKNMFENRTHLKSDFELTSTYVAYIYNAVRERLVTPTSLANPITFLNTLFYNSDLYKFKEEDIRRLFSFYRTLKEFNEWTSYKNLKGLNIADSDQLAKNCLLVRGDDEFRQLFFDETKEGREKATEAFNALPQIGDALDDNDYEIVNKWKIRNVSEIKSFLTNLGVEEEKPEASANTFYIQVLTHFDVFKKAYRIENVSPDEAGGSFSGIFKDVEVKKNDKIRLVWASKTTCEKISLSDYLSSSNSRDAKAKAKYKEFIDNNGFVLIEKAKVNIFIRFTKELSTISIKDFWPTDISLKDGDGEEVETPPEEPKEEVVLKDVGEKKIKGKTLQEIKDMSDSEYETFKELLDDFEKSFAEFIRTE